MFEAEKHRNRFNLATAFAIGSTIKRLLFQTRRHSGWPLSFTSLAKKQKTSAQPRYKNLRGTFQTRSRGHFLSSFARKIKIVFHAIEFFLAYLRGKKRMWVFIGQEAARVKQARFCSSSFDTQQTFSSSTSRGWVVVRRAIQRMFRQLRKKSLRAKVLERNRNWCFPFLIQLSTDLEHLRATKKNQLFFAKETNFSQKGYKTTSNIFFPLLLKLAFHSFLTIKKKK